MTKYEHSQSQVILAAIVLAAAIFTFVSAIAGGEVAFFLAPILLSLVAALGFALSKLTTSVDDRAVTAAFRWGRPQRVIPLADIGAAHVVRNKWWYGLGIRIIPGATMFNVWGLDAVELELPGRNFRIGTDDPEGLAAAIERQRRS
jgi:hypothetical protein